MQHKNPRKANIENTQSGELNILTTQLLTRDVKTGATCSEDTSYPVMGLSRGNVKLVFIALQSQAIKAFESTIHLVV